MFEQSIIEWKVIISLIYVGNTIKDKTFIDLFCDLNVEYSINQWLAGDIKEKHKWCHAMVCIGYKPDWKKEICKKNTYHNLLEWQEQYLIMEGTLIVLYKRRGEVCVVFKKVRVYEGVAAQLMSGGWCPALPVQLPHQILPQTLSIR